MNQRKAKKYLDKLAKAPTYKAKLLPMGMSIFGRRPWSLLLGHRDKAIELGRLKLTDAKAEAERKILEDKGHSIGLWAPNKDDPRQQITTYRH